MSALPTTYISNLILILCESTQCLSSLSCPSLLIPRHSFKESLAAQHFLHVANFRGLCFHRLLLHSWNVASEAEMVLRLSPDLKTVGSPWLCCAHTLPSTPPPGLASPRHTRLTGLQRLGVWFIPTSGGEMDFTPALWTRIYWWMLTPGTESFTVRVRHVDDIRKRTRRRPTDRLKCGWSFCTWRSQPLRWEG